LQTPTDKEAFTQCTMSEFIAVCAGERNSRGAGFADKRGLLTVVHSARDRSGLRERGETPGGAISMRFSELGPNIPEELIEGSLNGNIVFVCGAGVSKSKANLPLFDELVRNIYTRLDEAQTQGEEVAFTNNRFEETLGALSRRVADPRRMLRAVGEELQAGADVDLSAHDTLLGLSRNLEGKPVLVTTNFDTLFERRLSQMAGQEPAASLSHAGAQVSTPGGLRFEGVIHLHGRLADPLLGIDATDLVLTSADFGDVNCPDFPGGWLV
jgi:hypothetical protein